MNAFNLAQSSSEPSDGNGSGLARGGSREGSMEEILASIRRIIAQDQELFAAEHGEPAEGGEGPGASPGAEEADALAGQSAGAGFDAAEPLTSPETGDSVAGAFNTLVASRLVQNSDAILAMTREALRPMLEAWLDAHLPAIVERLVRAEIERLTRGA